MQTRLLCKATLAVTKLPRLRVKRPFRFAHGARQEDGLPFIRTSGLAGERAARAVGVASVAEGLFDHTVINVDRGGTNAALQRDGGNRMNRQRHICR